MRAVKQTRVLIVDHQLLSRDVLKQALSDERDIHLVGATPSGNTGVSRTEQVAPEVVVVNGQLQDLSPETLTRRIHEINPEVGVLLVTQHEGGGPPPDQVARALGAGAFDSVLHRAEDLRRDDAPAAMARQVLPKIRSYTATKLSKEAIGKSTGSFPAATVAPAAPAPGHRPRVDTPPVPLPAVATPPPAVRPRANTPAVPHAAAATPPPAVRPRVDTPAMPHAAVATPPPAVRPRVDTPAAPRPAMPTPAPAVRPRVDTPAAPRPAMPTPPPAAAPGGRAKPRAKSSRIEVVVIGVSTGGPEALGQLLPLLPRTLPVPVAVVIHLPQLFTDSLVSSLQQKCPLNVQEAADGRPLQAGTIVVASGGKHLQVRRGAHKELVMRTPGLPPRNGCCPSADVLFESAARYCTNGALAILLTGMGNDGVDGMRAVQASGGRTFAQDEVSSVVWGMPGRAVQAGVVDEIVPLRKMAARILEMVVPT